MSETDPPMSCHECAEIREFLEGLLSIHGYEEMVYPWVRDLIQMKLDGKPWWEALVQAKEDCR